MSSEIDLVHQEGCLFIVAVGVQIAWFWTVFACWTGAVILESTFYYRSQEELIAVCSDFLSGSIWKVVV